jgi:curved DNA-binding protein CbpA
MSNFSVNFYEVLGVEPNAPMKEIKKQYSKLVVKYHPDKVKDSFETSLFELIQKAYETVGNEQKRQEYDFFLKNLETAKGNDWFSLKSNYDKFKDLEETQPKNKESSQIEFDKVFKEFDDKLGIDRSKLDEKINEDEIINHLDNLVLQREQDEIEFSQNKIFKEGEGFDISKFNAAFDMYKTTSDKQVIKQTNVMAYNFEGNGTSFSDLNVYDKTFNEEDNFEGNGLYSNVNIGKSNKLDTDKVRNLKPADYTLSHNKLETNYDDEIKRRLAERDQESVQFDTMKYQDFKTEDKSFQFSQDVGITENMLDWTENNNEDLLKACKKLIELEKRSPAK